MVTITGTINRFMICRIYNRYQLFGQIFIQIILSMLFTMHGFAQVSKPDTVIATYSEDPIKLDGQLGEAIWQKSMRISNFTQRELNVGAPATERTEVAVIYSSNTLYIGFWGYDREPNNIIAKEMKRDFEFSRDDNFEVIIDSYSDDRNGFLFVVNPNGARADAQILDNGNSQNSFWNGVWDVRTTITSEGWFAEIAIPFSTLKFKSNVERQLWGINFERNIRRKREQLLWQGWSRDSELEQVNKAGTLAGLDKIQDKDFVEIKPYAISGIETGSGNNKTILNAGGDINYLLSPTLRLNFTANTDFAQVEADRQQINLTRFPLFFPERREFFLEGQDFFDMGMGSKIIPFYSRRIGLAEDRTTVPIIAGTRLIGKINNSTIGVMSMQTAGKDNAPSTNYSVLSWRQDVLDQSTIGILSANVYAKDRLHSTTGGYGRYSTSKLFGDKNLNVGLSAVQNYNSDNFDASANAYRVYVNYPNDRVEFDASWQRSGENFNPEAGFLLRQNFQEFYSELEFKPRPKNMLKWIRQFSIKPLDVNYYIYDSSKKLQSFFYELRPLGFETRSGESFEFNVQLRAEGLDNDFEITEGTIIPAAEYWWQRFEIQAETFSGRILSAGTSINWGGFYKGNSIESEYFLQWRASKYFNINMNYENNQIDLPQGNFHTNLIGSRAEYAVNPKLFGSMLTQWNSEDKEMFLNFRLQWIPKIGADFFFIVNQLYDTSPEKWSLSRTTVIGKLVWRLVI